MELVEFSCPRGHTFRTTCDATELPCPSAVEYDSVSGEVRFCREVAHRVGPRVDAEAYVRDLPRFVDDAKCFCLA